MKFFDSKVSFAAGELSPVLAARADLAAYSIGAAELTNCLVLPQGGIINRPGTKRLTESNTFVNSRLVPFVNGKDSLCLVFKQNKTIDVYRPSGYVTSISGSPYGANELPELRWNQSMDVIYLFHPRVPVQKLLHISDSNWSIENVSFKHGPYQEMNTDENHKMWLGGAWLYSNVPFFTQDMMGMLVKLEVKIKASSGDALVGHVGGSPDLYARFTLFGASTIETHGNWNNRSILVLRKEPDDLDFDTSNPFRTWVGDGSNNFGLSVNEEEYGVEYKVIMTGATSGNVRITWSSGGGLINRNLEINFWGNSTSVGTKSVDNIRGSVAETSNWAIGAFGKPFGYPAIGIFHQERLVLGGTPSEPQTIWMSQPASWEDFGTSIPALDTDSITVTLAARNRNDVKSFSSREDLLVFTSEAEWVGAAGSKSDVFTPSSVSFVASGNRGAEPLDPLEVGQSILFLQKHGKTVRALGYQLDIDGYASSELSVLSSHLFEGTKVVRWSYQQEPWSVAWIVLDNGEVLGLTLQQEHQVTAWSRHLFNGHVKDVCAVPGAEQEELFMLIDNKLCVMNHREDRVGLFNEKTFLDDEISPYVSVFESMELEQNIGNGSLQGRHKQVSGATIRLFRSTGVKAGIVTENSRALDRIHDSQTPYTGDINVRLPGGAGRLCRIRVENDKPGPLSVLGIFQEVDVSE